MAELKDLFEFTNSCEDWEWDDAKEQLQEALSKIKIKTGFLEVFTGGWREQHGMTPIFEINVNNLISKFGDFEWTIQVQKEGHQLQFVMSSHDKPTGVRILLKPASQYDAVYAEIFAV